MRFILQNDPMRVDRSMSLRAINLPKPASIGPLIAALAEKFRQR